MLRRRPISSVLPVLSLLLILLYYISTIPRELYSYYDLIRQQTQQQQCRLMELNPYDPSIMQYIAKAEPVVCKRFQPDLVYLTEDGYLTLNQTAVREAGYAVLDLSCWYRCFEHNTGVSDDIVKYDKWAPLGTEPLLLTCQFVEVSCTKGPLSVSVYKYHLFQLVPKLEPVSATRSDVNSQRVASSSDRVNLIVLGIDSMSTSNMVRQLPKSLEYLTQHMNATIFKGHSKVGDNTWVNMIAMLTGKLVQSTKEFPTDLDDSTYDRFFDDWADYIWKNFSEKGYRTFFAEDRADISTFNYAPKKGFKYPPTDHYFRTFWAALHWCALHMRSSAFCYNARAEHEFNLEYLRQFIVKYTRARVPHFAFMWWQNLSHDLLNRIGGADEDVERFLRAIHSSLNNTILLVLSDHGHRYDAIRQSVIGRLEARMPFLGMVLPDWMKTKYPALLENVRQNSDRLTTQFDIYATMVDVLEGNFEERIKEQLLPGPPLSLFRPIPENRYCLIAKIPEDYCPCYQETRLSVTEPRVQEAAHALLEHANELMDSLHPGLCAHLRLHSIHDAHVFLPSLKMLKDPQVGDKSPISGFHLSYRIQVETYPNHALLEGVVKRFLDQGTYKVDGDIDRNNAYGNTSYCVSERILKKICFCESQV